ncbi:hypothetical protein NL676_038215 [Syzygium grande]|nr:hypothetical protein NL676_038215 [Syzygium grande]
MDEEPDVIVEDPELMEEDQNGVPEAMEQDVEENGEVASPDQPPQQLPLAVRRRSPVAVSEPEPPRTALTAAVVAGVSRALSVLAHPVWFEVFRSWFLEFDLLMK